MAASDLTVHGLPAFANLASNPYNTLLYDALRALGVEVREYDDDARRRPGDVVHVHWPESHLNHPRLLRAAPRSASLLRALRRDRRQGAALVWTAHNLASHARGHPGSERLFWSQFIPLVDGWTAMSEEASTAVTAKWPVLAQRPHAVIPHGTYEAAYDAPPDRMDARDRLGLPRDVGVLAFVGRIKPYKGVPALVDAFRALRSPDLRLSIAGRIENDRLRTEIRTAIGDDVRVHLIDGSLPAAEVPVHLAAADVVVAPFVDILNSGSVLLALSFGRPVLAPAIGGMPALQQMVGGAWLRLYEPPLLPRHLEQALQELAVGTPDLTEFRWPSIAARTLDLYRAASDHANARRR